eukprot:841664_1
MGATCGCDNPDQKPEDINGSNMDVHRSRKPDSNIQNQADNSLKHNADIITADNSNTDQLEPLVHNADTVSSGDEKKNTKNKNNLIQSEHFTEEKHHKSKEIGKHINLKIKSMNSKFIEFDLDIDPNYTVADLKNKITKQS